MKTVAGRFDSFPLPAPMISPEKPMDAPELPS